MLREFTYANGRSRVRGPSHYANKILNNTYPSEYHIIVAIIITEALRMRPALLMCRYPSPSYNALVTTLWLQVFMGGGNRLLLASRPGVNAVRCSRLAGNWALQECRSPTPSASSSAGGPS
ncbi:hypothetical protein EVAR_8523_1 [Eumeta japonica]|uniref:Uncharacterized protein n=1 Tax=Eumeta variegata TaxID=151549 RepID=A0A4C1TXQ3_EUMVA|nr:hypothetical protein EVAR_8523_1 [Eumeta japonica]